MTEWITLDPSAFKTAKDFRDVKGAKIVIGLSPDDMPEMVRGRYLTETGEYAIEFKYLTPASEIHQVLNLKTYRPAIPVVGAQTGRLYQIRFKIPIRDGMKQQINSSIDEMLQDDRFRGRGRQYKVAAEAVCNNAEFLDVH